MVNNRPANSAAAGRGAPRMLLPFAARCGMKIAF
jgi:hypothetical protein